MRKLAGKLKWRAQLRKRMDVRGIALVDSERVNLKDMSGCLRPGAIVRVDDLHPVVQFVRGIKLVKGA